MWDYFINNFVIYLFWKEDFEFIVWVLQVNWQNQYIPKICYPFATGKQQKKFFIQSYGNVPLFIFILPAWTVLELECT